MADVQSMQLKGELDDVFEKSDSVPEVQEPEPEKGEIDVEPPSTEEQPADEPERENAQVPREALIAERKKRQELEDKLKSFESNQPKKEVEPEPEVDLFADPDGFRRQVSKTISDTAWETKVTLSQEMMRELKPDYDEKEAAFLEAIKDNPSLGQQIRNQANPAKFAYQQGAKWLETGLMQKDPEAYKAKLEAEFRAKWEAEKSGKPVVKATRQIPPSLATANGARTSDEAPIDDLAGLFPELR